MKGCCFKWIGSASVPRALVRTDLQMLSIRQRIESRQPPATLEAVLREKIRRLDMAEE